MAVQEKRAHNLLFYSPYKTNTLQTVCCPLSERNQYPTNKFQLNFLCRAYTFPANKAYRQKFQLFLPASICLFERT